ncbi:MAG: hypothetical protein ACK5Y6_08455 [Pseudomonadota bacterium]|jgi:hypothetical protein
MQSAVATELTICARLLRALAHRVRGDLSVITNDLAYIATMIDPTELERPRSRCSKIAHTLGSLSALGSVGRREVVGAELILEKFLIDKGYQAAVNGHQVEVDLEALGQMVALLRELCGEWRGDVELGSDSLECRLRFKEQRQLKASYDTMSDFAAAELGERYVVEGCLIDLIGRDHGWVYQVTQLESEAALTVIVPIKGDARG